jgi:hypothetical protein
MTRIYVAASIEDRTFAGKITTAFARVRVDAQIVPLDLTTITGISGLIRSADMVVVVLSLSAAESKHLRTEVRVAQVQSKRMIPVLISGETIPALFEGEAIIDMRTDRTAGFKALLALVRGSSAVELGQLLPASGPFDPTAPPVSDVPFETPPIPRLIILLLALVMVVGTGLGFALFA